MRYLAIDLGHKRTGLAVGDSVTRLVTPLQVLEVPLRSGAETALLDAIARVIQEQLGPRDALVLGLPINMDDTEGPRARLVRDFGRHLADRTGRAVEYQDERLTSSDADWAMAHTGMTHGQKKRRRDALAAAAILRDFLGRSGPGTLAGPDGGNTGA